MAASTGVPHPKMTANSPPTSVNTTPRISRTLRIPGYPNTSLRARGPGSRGAAGTSSSAGERTVSITFVKG